MITTITPKIPIISSFLKSPFSMSVLGGLNHYNAGINQLEGINFK